MRTLLVGAIATMTACASGLTEPSTTPTAITTGAIAPTAVPSTSALAPTAPAPPEPAPPLHEVVLPHIWKATVGRTDQRTTMAVVGTTVAIGTHGGSFDALDEASDGVYLIDGTTGRIVRKITAPGHGNRDVNGIALDAGRVFFSAGNGQVVAAQLDGRILWAHALGAEPLAAPTLVEVNGDGILDVVVGDAAGRVHALDGRSGREIWVRATSPAGANPASAIEAGVAAADLEGDGKRELVVAGWDGTVSALRASNGESIWSIHDGGRVRASPVLVDVDGDGRLEVIATWEAGASRILDGRTGRELWSTVVGRDEKVHVNLLGAAIPFLTATAGALAVPVGREPAGDGLFLVGERGTLLRSGDARVVGTPVVAALEPGLPQDLVFGTSTGEVVAIDPSGRRSTVARVGGPIDASIAIADVDGDGIYEVLVASDDGILTCLTTGTRDAPALGRFRGDSTTNDGVMRPTNLRWALGRDRRIAGLGE